MATAIYYHAHARFTVYREIVPVGSHLSGSGVSSCDYCGRVQSELYQYFRVNSKRSYYAHITLRGYFCGPQCCKDHNGLHRDWT